MYGSDDIYNSPSAENFGDEELAQIDAYLDEDDEDEDEEFGGGLLGRGSILGIAIGDKAKRNRMNRILGNLKQYLEQGKQDKARRYAKALGRIDPIKKNKEGWVTPEVQAWLDYAETGDWDALNEALEAVAWTGKEMSEDDDAVEEGEVYTEGGGGGRPHRGRGRRLPPGFRPRGYSTWPAARKAHWLARHPRAASIRIPIDPGPMPGRRRPGRPGRPVRSVAAPRLAPRLVPRSVAAPRPGYVRPGYSRPRPVANTAAPRPFRMAAARAAGRQFARSRYGLEEAVSEGVEEFGALIGTDAFLQLQGKDSLKHDVLFEDDLDDEIGGDSDDDLDDEFGAYIASYGDEDDDEFGAYIPGYGAYVPQFGAMFKRDIEDRLEAARRRYERLRAKETDQTKVSEAYNDYQRLVRAYAAASRLPSAERKGPALARELGYPAEAPEAGDYEAPQSQVFRLRGRVAMDEGDEDDLGEDEDFSVGSPA